MVKFEKGSYAERNNSGASGHLVSGWDPRNGGFRHVIVLGAPSAAVAVETGKYGPFQGTYALIDLEVAEYTCDF